MTNDIPNPPMPNPPPPMMSQPAAPRSVFQTWVDAITKPNETTYAAMANASNASATTAFIWVFIASLISAFLSFLVQGAAFRRMLEQQGLGGQIPRESLGARVITLVCGAPVAAVFSVIGFAIVVALVQWIARMFGGRGTFNQLAFVFSAIAVPVTLVTALLTLLGAIPFVGICFGIVGGLFGLYALFLQITAVKGVNGFGWGPAAGSVLIPIAALLLVCCCLIFGIAALVGASLGNVFSQLGPFPVPTP
jgi:hypothetical protein